MTSDAPVPPTPLTLEQKIDQAALEAAQIASQFSEKAGGLITAGAQAEPIIAGLLAMFAGIFSHKAKAATKE
jgi:hypothetical protein